jgi:hypothetical protein
MGRPSYDPGSLSGICTVTRFAAEGGGFGEALTSTVWVSAAPSGWSNSTPRHFYPARKGSRTGLSNAATGR